MIYQIKQGDKKPKIPCFHFFHDRIIQNILYQPLDSGRQAKQQQIPTQPSQHEKTKVKEDRSHGLGSEQKAMPSFIILAYTLMAPLLAEVIPPGPFRGAAGLTPGGKHNPGIAPVRRLVNEQVVIARFKMKVACKAFVLKKQRLFIG